MNAFLVGYVGLVLSAMAIAVVQNTVTLNASEWASWVQAIGSIGAILGAAWGITYQARRQQRDRRKAFLAVAEAATSYAEKFSSALAGEERRWNLYRVFDQSIVDSMVGALSAVPIHEIGSRDAIIAFVAIRDQFVFLGKAISIFLAGPWQHPDIKQGLEEARKLYTGDQRPMRELVMESEQILANNAQAHVGNIQMNFEALQRALDSAR